MVEACWRNEVTNKITWFYSGEFCSRNDRRASLKNYRYPTYFLEFTMYHRYEVLTISRYMSLIQNLSKNYHQTNENRKKRK